MYVKQFASEEWREASFLAFLIYILRIFVFIFIFITSCIDTIDWISGQAFGL